MANYAAGLVEPKRYATIRLKNLYDQIGLVADISDKTAVPERDALSTSPHGLALIEHMRGHVVKSLTVEPELPIIARIGSIEVPDAGPATVRPSDGVAVLEVPVRIEGLLRCYYLGLLAATDAPVRVTARVDLEGGSHRQPVTFELPVATSVAAVLEVERLPFAGEHMQLRLETEAETVTLYDLFVIATG